MANRLLNIAALGSATIFCLIIVAWLIAGHFDPRRQFVSLSRECHLSIDHRGEDGRLEIFNDANYGPYAGSIIAFTGDPNGPSISGFGDTAGIYYRLIRWPNGTSLWTLSVSLSYPLIVAAVLPAIWLFRRSRRVGGIQSL